MLHTIQHIIFWGKFRSLNKQYHTLIEQAKSEGDEATMQHVEERFWHETAILLEERRRLQILQATGHTSHSNLSVPTTYPHHLIASPTKTETSYLFPQHPPSAFFIVLFSLLGSIAMGTGILWLIAP